MEHKSGIVIFTDGSSRGNPGSGGWAVVIVKSEKLKGQSGTHVTELGGNEKVTTNNRMELRAALEGLRAAPKDESITVYTDSSYLINGITKWVKGWKRNGWQTKTKDDVLNKDLWMDLDEAAAERTVSWKYVGGHVGILGNERCDHIATAFADGREVKLYGGPLGLYDLPDILNVYGRAQVEGQEIRFFSFSCKGVFICERRRWRRRSSSFLARMREEGQRSEGGTI